MSGAASIKSMSLSIRLLRQGRAVENALREDHELTEVEAVMAAGFLLGKPPALPPTSGRRLSANSQRAHFLG